MFLFPHLGTIIWVTLIFLIVLFFMSKYAWKPLLNAIEQREKTIEGALNSAKIAEQKLANIENEQKLIVEQANQEKFRLLKEGSEQKDKIILSAHEKAQIEADKIIEDARKKILLEKEAAISDMRKQIAELSIEIATKVVHVDMEDKTRYERLVNELIKEVELN